MALRESKKVKTREEGAFASFFPRDREAAYILRVMLCI